MLSNYFINKIIPNNLGYNAYEYLYRTKKIRLNEKDINNKFIIWNGYFPKKIVLARNKNGEHDYQKIVKKDIDEQIIFSEKRIQKSKEIIYFYPYEEFEIHKNNFIYDYLKEKTNKKIKMIINNNFLKKENYYHFDLYRYDYFSKKKLFEISFDLEKKFLFLNNKKHQIREKIYDFIFNNEEIKKNSYYSFIYKGIDLWGNKINKNFYEICEGQKCFYKTHTDFLSDDYLSNNSRYFFNKSFLYVITETNPFLNFNFLTEKTYKAFYHGMPFLLISSAHSLEHLKKIGFKTFDKWIDESYDKEKKIKNRLKIIFNEINRINQIDINELKKIKKDMFSVLKHNRDLYLYNMEKEFLLFFKKIDDN